MTTLDEFKLIDFIKKHNTKPTKQHNVAVDIGDDCFVYNSHQKAKYVVTTDILIENIHFKTAWATPEQIGQKSIEVNVSDIASMGNAKPLYAFISMGIPKGTDDKFIKKLFSSIKKTCDKYGIHLSGGDTVGADCLTISVTLIGISYDKIITRTGAKKGDLIFVSGTFGDSGAGLEAIYNLQFRIYNERQELRKIGRLEDLKIRNYRMSECQMFGMSATTQNSRHCDERSEEAILHTKCACHTALDAVSHCHCERDYVERGNPVSCHPEQSEGSRRFSASQLLSFSANERSLVQRHLVPEARLKLANDLSKKLKITSMTDSSDGLFKSVELIAGNKGAVINMEDIPVSKNLVKYCAGNSDKLYNLALFGGEEFELVFTIDKKDEQKAKKLFKDIKCIGSITDDKKIKYIQNNKIRNIKDGGYKHF